MNKIEDLKWSNREDRDCEIEMVKDDYKEQDERDEAIKDIKKEYRGNLKGEIADLKEKYKMQGHLLEDLPAGHILAYGQLQGDTC